MTCLSEKAGQGYYYEDHLLIHKRAQGTRDKGAIAVERALEEAAAKNRPHRVKGFWGEGRRKGWGHRDMRLVALPLVVACPIP